MTLSQGTSMAADTCESLQSPACNPGGWHEPLRRLSACSKVTKRDLETLAYTYFELFAEFFLRQPEGDLDTEVTIVASKRMTRRLALAYLFDHKVSLNYAYFRDKPSLLPHTLFHEMTHLWLYDCYLDPGHTRRFYGKMEEFACTGLPVDPQIHIHQRVAEEARYVYRCPACRNRWHTRNPLDYPIYCGYCFDRYGEEHYAELVVPTAARAGSPAA